MNVTPRSVRVELQGVAFALEGILPISLIREHTKTDDHPAVSDTMLELYRDAAFEAAEQYTGTLFRGIQPITEDIEPQSIDWSNPGRQNFIHKLEYPPADNFVYYYGVRSSPVQQIPVKRGSRNIRLPLLHGDFGIGCCNPCGDANIVARIQYRAGYDCEASVPSAFKLGALKYIAHVIENPGDIVIAVSQSGAARTTGVGVQDASNPVVASGALEIWRVLVKDAI